jgi:electron transport complex protein RnfC
MLKSRFWGGVRPLGKTSSGKGPTKALPVEQFVPKNVRLPMNMHMGAPSRPIVHEGERVKIGQLVAEAEGPLGVLVHASISGVVTEVRFASIAIENDFKDEWVELRPLGDVEECDAGAILDAIKAAGICGMGGAGFPTHVKMRIPSGSACEMVILNGAECETHMTCDHRLMAEQPERVLKGLRAAMRALGTDKGVVAIEDNKPDAVEAMRKAAFGKDGVSVMMLATRYPQGGEKQLIQAVAGREVPAGKLPIDVGVVVLNVATAAAIADAVVEGKPLVERIVTVSGRVKRPTNLRVPIGTSVGEILEFSGGVEKNAKVVLGGAMMGGCAEDSDAPVVKGTGGIVVYRPKDLPEPTPCIRCGRCAQVCPAGLLPYELEAFILSKQLGRAEETGVMDCILCGCCSYICPARRKLVFAFRDARAQIQAERRKP